jgi:predicted Holliday junction resolvase-like endonuclease
MFEFICYVITLLCIVCVIHYRARYKEILSRKISSEVRLGQIAEHLVPFLENFKHDPKRAHFLGMPIDYIVFDDDKITFVEVKTGYSHLSPKQQAIKKLIEDKQVYWEELRLSPKTKQ